MTERGSTTWTASHDVGVQSAMMNDDDGGMVVEEPAASSETGRKRSRSGRIASSAEDVGGGSSSSGVHHTLPGLLFQRQRRGRLAPTGQAALLRHAERLGVTSARGAYVALPRSAKSTIALAISPCGRLVASTHGDHTVKVTEFHTGRLLHTLVGHARTPWTVKFHPRDPSLLCSGCIGGEVRLWSLPTGRCLRTATLDLPVISLAFHPSTNNAGGGRAQGPAAADPGGGAASGQEEEEEQQHLLAIATFHSLYLWPYARLEAPYQEWHSARLLRCVLFPPGGRALLLGLGNDSGGPPPRHHPLGGGGAAAAVMHTTAPRRPGPKAFHLVLWRFDAHKALVPRLHRPPPAPSRPTGPHNRERTPTVPAYASPLSRPQPLLERALLYNDGGVDVSSFSSSTGQGQPFLVACAEMAPADVPAASEAAENGGEDMWSLRPYLVRVGLPVDDEEGEEGQGAAGGKKEEEDDEEAPAWATETAEDTRRRARAIIPSSPNEQPHPPPLAQQQRQRQRRLLPPVQAAWPLDDVAPGGVTSVKLSGSGQLVLLGYGVRDAAPSGGATRPVLSVFDASSPGRLSPLRTIETSAEEEDVNIARFHPSPAQGFVYGTKQGRVCVFMPGRCRRRRGPGLVVDDDVDDDV